ncbi:MAG: sensor histidine kinase, partial [Pseudomonadota bacterium]
RSADFGYTKGTIWLRMNVLNLTEASTDWRMHFRENFFPFIRVYVATDGGTPVLIEAHDQDMPFTGRKLSYPDVMVPLVLPLGERSTIYVAYQSGGASQTSFALRTAESFATHATTRTAKNFIYYGMMLFLMIAATVAFLATRLGVFAAYAAFALSGVMFLMHADGNAFRYLWPNWPHFNAFASILTGWGVIVSGSNFARHFLQTRKFHRVFDVLLLGAMILATGMVLSTVIVDTQWVKKYLVLLAFLSIVLFTLSGLNAARTRFREVRFYVLAWSGAVISSAIMTARHWLGIDISEEFQFDSMRIVTVFDAAFMGLAILDRFNQLKHARQQALESSLSAAQQSLELSRRLRELEERVEVAQDLAETRGQRLSDTAHDLRQPLHALRLNVQALVNNPTGSSVKATDIEETFTFLETLVASELNAQSTVVEAAAPTRDRVDTELGQVLGRINDMFGPDARAKGLELSVVPSGARFAVPALDLMRIAGNLVSNAIKYTETGKVLVGVRRVDGMPRLEIHDTGSGMTETDFQQALQRGARLENGVDLAEGHGLGLSIVSKLAAEHGLEVQLIPRNGGGTSIGVHLPRV